MFRRGSAYYVRLYADGREKWISLGQDLAEAKQRLYRLRAGEPVTERITVAQACEKWLESYVRTARNADGQKLARVRASKYLLPFLGPRLLSKVETEDLRAYRIWLEGRVTTPQTVAHILSDARCLFGWCEDTGLLSRSPVPRKLLPKVQERPPNRLTDEEAEAVAQVPEPYGFVVRLGLGTGLRWGELTRAQSSDLQNGILVVHHTKTGRVRRVPLPPGLLTELRSRVGKLVPFSPRGQGSFARMVKRLSGVERFHPHRMRHTFACKWLERGGSLAALQAILGHSTVVTTQRYARLTDEAVQREAARLAGA
jgi:integrase